MIDDFREQLIAALRDPEVVNILHNYSDYADSPEGLHHSLGLRHDQASYGNHSHNGIDSATLIGAYVDLLSAQSVGGAKTFTAALNGLLGLFDNGNRVYSAGNPPPYPVVSVVGRTGAVTLTAADIASGTFPAGAFLFTNSVNALTGVFDTSTRVYSPVNPPPYPVTGVAGRTGAVFLTAADIAAGNFPNGTFAFPGNVSLGADVSALQMRFAQGIVATSETTASTTYANLTTVGPQATVTVPSSGAIKVTLSAQMSNNTAGASCLASVLAQDLTNASTTVFSPSDNESAVITSGVAGNSSKSAHVFVIGGLTVGHSILVSMQYHVTSGTGTFLRRVLVVEPCI